VKTYDAVRDRAPLGHLGRWPLYAATVLVAVHVAAMTLLAAWQAGGGRLAELPFRREAVLRGEVWRLVSYALLNPPSLWFAVEMYLLFVFGRELETYLGRRAFLRLYAALVLAAPAVLLALPGSALAGAGAAHLAVFIAFAVLYPGAQVFFQWTAKWVAVVVVALNALQALSVRAWDALVALLVSAGLAYAYVRRAQGRWTLRRPAWRLRQPAPGAAAPPAPPADVDAVLDKVARAGLASLTPRERAQLEQARQRLLHR